MDAFSIHIFFATLLTAACIGLVELFHLLRRPRHLATRTPTPVFRELLGQSGHARYGIIYVEKALFLSVIWILAGILFWPGIQWFILFAIWWAWRRGVFR